MKDILKKEKHRPLSLIVKRNRYAICVQVYRCKSSQQNINKSNLLMYKTTIQVPIKPCIGLMNHLGNVWHALFKAVLGHAGKQMLNKNSLCPVEGYSQKKNHIKIIIYAKGR